MPHPVADAELRKMLPYLAEGIGYREVAKIFSCSVRLVKNRARMMKDRGMTVVVNRTTPIIDGQRKCKRCSAIKDIDEFYEKGGGRRSTKCKPCSVMDGQCKKYGLAADVVVTLKVAETCPICERPFNEIRKACIDHHHDSGIVRGMICCLCNHAIGQIAESPETARRMTAYLEEWGPKCQSK